MAASLWDGLPSKSTVKCPSSTWDQFARLVGVYTPIQGCSVPASGLASLPPAGEGAILPRWGAESWVQSPQFAGASSSCPMLIFPQTPHAWAMGLGSRGPISSEPLMWDLAGRGGGRLALSVSNAQARTRAPFTGAVTELITLRLGTF